MAEDQTTEPDVIEGDPPALPAELDVGQAPPAPEPNGAAPEWTEEDEAEARAFGWKSPDEWKGDVPPTYIDDPRRYMERAENFAPFRKLKDQYSDMERRLEGTDERFRKLESMSQTALDRQKAQHEATLAQLKADQRASVESGDVERFDALRRQEDDLIKAAPAAQAPQPEGPPKAIADYVAANEWAQDPALFAEAARVIEATPGALGQSPERQIAIAEAAMKKRYPHLFTAPAPKAPPRQNVDGGGLGMAPRKGFPTLPDDAKAQFRKFVTEGLYEDNDKGRREYFEEYDNA